MAVETGIFTLNYCSLALPACKLLFVSNGTNATHWFMKSEHVSQLHWRSKNIFNMFSIQIGASAFACTHGR